MATVQHGTRPSLDRLPHLEHVLRQGLYRGGAGPQVGTLRGALGWEEIPGEVDLPDVKVTGALPGWVSGTLLRTGPGKWDLGGSQLEHWWDGLALLQWMVHRAISMSADFTNLSFLHAFGHDGIGGVLAGFVFRSRCLFL